jgi:hypothetical protein
MLNITHTFPTRGSFSYQVGKFIFLFGFFPLNSFPKLQAYSFILHPYILIPIALILIL